VPNDWGEVYDDYAPITAPGPPPTGKSRVYLDAADAKLKVKKSSGQTLSLEEQGGSGGNPPSGTGWRHVTNGTEDSAASTPTASQVGADASGAAAAAVSTHQVSYDHGLLHSNALDHNGGAQDSAIAARMLSTAFSGLTKISVGTGQPGSPNAGDLWLDCN
jgi:hypothetical protein